MTTNVKSKQTVSLILPTYNEEEGLPHFYERVVRTAVVCTAYDFEFVFVDDCSQDRTAAILDELRARDGRVGIVRFAKNCGSHAAIAAGLLYCRGDLAVIMAVDLQDPPEIVIPRMLAESKKGFRVVWGVRTERKGEGIGRKIPSRLFYFLVNVMTYAKQPPSGVGAILISRPVIEAVNQTQEKNLSIAMLIAWMGFSQTSVGYAREARHAGVSKWTIAKKIKLSLDSLLSFSYIPIRLMSLAGVICTLSGAVYAAHIVMSRLFHHVTVTGWSSLMIAVLVIGGVQMLMLGMLGEYLWRVYDEVRPRPRYVIERNTMTEGRERA